MRREILRASADHIAEEAHAITFQITDGAARFARIVLAHAPSYEDALELFRHNWHRIEETARVCLADPCFDGPIKLVMA